MKQDEIGRYRKRCPKRLIVSGITLARAAFGVFVDLASDARALLEVGNMDLDAMQYGVDDSYVLGSNVTARILSVYPDGQIRLIQRDRRSSSELSGRLERQ